MGDTRTRLSHITIALHWTVAVAIIVTMLIGLSMDDRRQDGDPLFSIHMALGVLILGLALVRVGWRTASGFPPLIGDYAAWERTVAKVVHIALLIATVAVPATGMMIVLGHGDAIDVFGLFTLGPPGGAPLGLVADIGRALHGTLANLLIFVVVLHVVGALKHHVIDHDATLRRMLGARG